MTDQKSSKIIINMDNLGDNWLIINKITTKQFNALVVAPNIDYILIKRLKFDSKMDNIPVFIKKIYIECVKFDDYWYNEQTFQKDDFKIFKNNREDLLLLKTYNFFEKRYQPFFQKFIKCPFNVTIKHFQMVDTFEHSGKCRHFDFKMVDKEQDTVTLIRRFLSKDYVCANEDRERMELKQRLKIADNMRMIAFIHKNKYVVPKSLEEEMNEIKYKLKTDDERKIIDTIYNKLKFI